jgi:NAD-dependent dihydropyrimidine dehydrogenase PreA subunit
MCAGCGYTKQHVFGEPCRGIRCPVCGKPLVRGEGQMQGNERDNRTKPYAQSYINRQSENRNSNKADNGFPAVDAEKCTGCGICVELCPRDAIDLQNGVAHILVENCINCRLCIRKCPEGAIH